MGAAGVYRTGGLYVLICISRSVSSDGFSAEDFHKKRLFLVILFPSQQLFLQSLDLFFFVGGSLDVW
jgi:hypothetical protein